MSKLQLYAYFNTTFGRVGGCKLENRLRSRPELQAWDADRVLKPEII